MSNLPIAVGRTRGAEARAAAAAAGSGVTAEVGAADAPTPDAGVATDSGASRPVGGDTSWPAAITPLRAATSKLENNRALTRRLIAPEGDVAR